MVQPRQVPVDPPGSRRNPDVFKSLPPRPPMTVEVQCATCGIILHVEPIKGEVQSCVCGQGLDLAVAQAA